MHGRTAFRSRVLALALLLPGPVLAAGFTCAQPAPANTPPPAKGQVAELDEVIVTPRRTVRRTKDLSAWLKRLEGQYTQNDFNSSLGALPLLYFGISPDTLEFQLVLVDDIVVGSRSGVLEGDTVNFSVDDWKVCPTSPFGSCWVFAEITAKPSGEIFMKFALDHWFQGRKLPIRTESGYTNFIELRLNRELPVDARVQGTAR